jgi:serine/threonine protein kinase
MLCNAHSRLKFSGGDPISKGILECIGYFADESHTRYGLISKLPTTLNKAPKSLQSLLCNPENRKGSRHDLNDRVVLARSVASAVLAIHSAQFVHKSIRPSNILVFDPQEPGTRGYPYKLGRPVIVGFEQTRPDSDDTERRGTTAWEENIYRHPERQGLKPKQRYSMMHDIYSLGVIFTEIAFWRSSLAEVKDKETGVITTYHNPDFWGNLYETRRKEDDPEKVQSFYKKLAKSAVPKHIGGRFASLIESCLTCLEGGFGGAKDDDNDAVIGAAYIERVVESLEAICL